MRTLCVIPARGGSKRIPRKNIKPFLGIPIIQRVIDVVLGSGIFTKVVVSTDDSEIAEVALKAGALLPFMRPPELADDYTTTVDVIAHAISELQKSGEFYDLVCCVYPTAVFMEASDLERGLQQFTDNSVLYSYPVTTFAFPIQRALTISETNRAKMFNPELFDARSQDLPEAYHDAGQFYWGRPIAWTQREPFFEEYAVPLVIPRTRAQDIDTEEDWMFAELLFKARTLTN